MEWAAPHHADPRLVEDLRSIDPDADLCYLADGYWALVVRPERWRLKDGGRRRRLTGLNILAKHRRSRRPDPVTMRAAMLLADGCGIVVQAFFPHGPDRELVEWFREATWLERNGGFDAAMDARMAESDGSAGDARSALNLADWRETEGRRSYRHVFRGSRSVSGRPSLN